jgi:hypothetical protein
MNSLPMRPPQPVARVRRRATRLLRRRPRCLQGPDTENVREEKDIPLTGVGVEVKRDNSQEQKGKYALHVKLTLKGVLTDAQREELHRVADRCPIHKLMTTSEVSIETHLSEGAFSQ